MKLAIVLSFVASAAAFSQVSGKQIAALSSPFIR